MKKQLLILSFLFFSLFSNAQTTSSQLKAQIDTDITNKTGTASISKTNVGSNLKAVVDYVVQEITKATRPYKSYAAVISQSGSSAPTAVVLENGFTGTPTYSYLSTGYYTVTLTGAFVTDKVLILAGPSDSGERVRITRTNTNSLTIEAFGTGGTSANSVISNFPVEIRVYN